jgi:hypothetical protein
MPSEEDLKELQANVARRSKGPARAKKHKYNAKKTEVDGIIFDSKKEAARYQELKLAEKAGLISGLELQPKFSIDINGIHICNYFADFRYQDRVEERFSGLKSIVVVEDVKGVKTPVYKLKKKLVKAIHGFDIVEV